MSQANQPYRFSRELLNTLHELEAEAPEQFPDGFRPLLEKHPFQPEWESPTPDLSPSDSMPTPP
jgi:hypothetical protein